MKIKHPRAGESGNVLFLILIAVALFAALAYAITHTSRSGGDASREKTELLVSEIVQYAAQLEQGVRAISVLENCSEENLSFHLSSNAALAAYEHGTETDNCRVFHPQGGDVFFDTPPINVNDGSGYFFYGGACVPGLGLGVGNCASDGSDNEELIMFLPNVTETVCQIINEKMNVTGRNVAPPQDQGNAYDTAVPFAGTFTEANAIADAGGVFEGKFGGCFEGGGTPAAGTYHFFQVLRTR